MILPDSVPVWVLTGVVMVGGWLYESSTSENISNTQALVDIHTYQIQNQAQDMVDIKSALVRIETYLLQNKEQ